MELHDLDSHTHTCTHVHTHKSRQDHFISWCNSIKERYPLQRVTHGSVAFRLLFSPFSFSLLCSLLYFYFLPFSSIGRLLDPICTPPCACFAISLNVSVSTSPEPCVNLCLHSGDCICRSEEKWSKKNGEGGKVLTGDVLFHYFIEHILHETSVLYR